MALRDRVTVRTTDGTVTVLQVKRQGGTVEADIKNGRVVVTLNSKAGDTVSEFMAPLDQVISYLKETEVAAEGKKKG